MEPVLRISVRKPQTPAERARRLRQKAIGLIDQAANELQKSVNLGYLLDLRSAKSKKAADERGSAQTGRSTKYEVRITK